MLPIAVLAGGFGTRLGTLTTVQPKCLIEINGRPFVAWQLDKLISNGYSEFVFCLSHKSDMIQDYLGDGSTWGVKIEYSFDGETQLGTGGAIQKALPMLGDAFGVIYGDSYLPICFSSVEKEFLSLKSLALMTVYKNQNRMDQSNIKFLNGKILEYRKGKRNREMPYIDYGLNYFKKEVFLPWINQPSYDLSIVHQELIRTGQLDGFEVFDRFYEIGSFRGIKDFSYYLRSKSNEL
jgi:MurNAc alpha-1-phosphate uridylyltransferase